MSNIKSKSQPEKLVAKHNNLTHSESMKVVSHAQRPAKQHECDNSNQDWVMHTLMLEGCSVPFKFLRLGKYQSLKGMRVNLTYYPEVELVAGMEFEIMKVVRIKRS